MFDIKPLACGGGFYYPATLGCFRANTEFPRRQNPNSLEILRFLHLSLLLLKPPILLPPRFTLGGGPSDHKTARLISFFGSVVASLPSFIRLRDHTTHSKGLFLFGHGPHSKRQAIMVKAFHLRMFKFEQRMLKGE